MLEATGRRRRAVALTKLDDAPRASDRVSRLGVDSCKEELKPRKEA